MKREQTALFEQEQAQDSALAQAGADEGALMRAGSSVSKLLRRSSLSKWRGEAVGDGNAREALFAKLRPKEMALINKAYRLVHELTDDEESYLTESMQAAGNDAGGA